MNDPALKPAMFARLVYLDQCLTWRGQVNRKDLIERFGISSPQAAIDFREYLERVTEPKPRYDAVRKCYLADSKHRGLHSLMKSAHRMSLSEALHPTDSLCCHRPFGSARHL